MIFLNVNRQKLIDVLSPDIIAISPPFKKKYRINTYIFHNFRQIDNKIVTKCKVPKFFKTEQKLKYSDVEYIPTESVICLYDCIAAINTELDALYDLFTNHGYVCGIIELAKDPVLESIQMLMDVVERINIQVEYDTYIYLTEESIKIIVNII